MHGILIFWKKSRIFKVLAVIVSVPILLFTLLLVPALPAWADSNPPETNYTDSIHFNYSWSSAVEPVAGSFSQVRNGYRYKYSWYRDYVCYFRIALDNYPMYVFNRYYGFIRFQGDLQVQGVLPENSGFVTRDAHVDSIELMSIDTDSGNTIGNYSSYSSQVIDEGVQEKRIYTTSFNLLYYFKDWTYLGSPIFDTIRVRYRVYFSNSSGTQYNGTVSASNNVSITQQYAWFTKGENYYLYNINENIKAASSSLNTGIVNAINNASNLANTNSINEKNAINAAASQAHTDAVTAHNDSVAEKNAINTAASQAHSDAQNLDNHMMNDSSNFSSNTNTFNNQVQTAQQAADQAVDNAVHSYEAQLDVVSDYDAISFFRDQSLASTFWRDIGEYILSTSNLGYFAAGLIVVTIIGLFVFLLRL